ncbi:MAG: porphobilinogen synthase [Ferroplasma sp.]
MFPAERMRRYRINSTIRDIFKESSINKDKLIMPIFVDENEKGKTEIRSMPGIFRYSIDEYEGYIKHLDSIGVKSILLFGIPKNKDSCGSSSYDKNGIVQQAIKIAKASTSMNVIADLCLCEYTDTGHCGIIENGYVDNDKTLEIYEKEAISYAEAGVDIIAPSGMMDGQVGAIRRALDREHFINVSIMAYSSKFASNLYGPFRDAADSTPQFGDRRSYQMDYSNGREAMREIGLDISEGADIIMVKPALFYMDIINQAHMAYRLPVATYMVSGEFAMIKNAVSAGLLNSDVIDEALTSLFRAGSDLVITYFAEDYIAGNIKGMHSR